MKCPYCNRELHCGAQLNSDGFIVELYQCSNPECEPTEFLVGCREFWDILGQFKRKTTKEAMNMPDIAMCIDDKCPLRFKCHRFTAVPDYWQSFCAFKYDNGCDAFWDNNGYKKRKGYKTKIFTEEGVDNGVSK